MPYMQRTRTGRPRCVQPAIRVRCGITRMIHYAMVGQGTCLGQCHAEAGQGWLHARRVGPRRRAGQAWAVGKCVLPRRLAARGADAPLLLAQRLFHDVLAQGADGDATPYADKGGITLPAPAAEAYAWFMDGGVSHRCLAVLVKRCKCRKNYPYGVFL